MADIYFFVPGIPKPGGSKTGFYNKKSGRMMIVDACDNKDWKNSVKIFCRENYKGQPIQGPISLEITFIMPRPKSHYRSNGSLKLTIPHYAITRPDSTKLLRATEDALTGLLWNDDAQIAVQTVYRIYGATPGAKITVSPISFSIRRTARARFLNATPQRA